MKHEAQQTNAFLPNYTPEEFQLLKELNEGDEELHDSYEEWRDSVAEVERALRSQGVSTRRIQLDIFTVILWCRECGLKFDGPARAQFLQETGALESSLSSK